MDIEKFHTILGLDPGASEEEIKHAYRVKVKENHPDLACGNPSLQKLSEEKMKDINAAYHALLKYVKKQGLGFENVRQRGPEPPKKGPVKHTSAQRGPFTHPGPKPSPPKKPGEGTIRSDSGTGREKNFFSLLFEQIISRLTLSKTKQKESKEKSKKTFPKRTVYDEPQREFSEILNDILRTQAHHEEISRSKNKSRNHHYDYYSMKSRQNRTKKTDPDGPVGSIRPVARVNGVFRD